jgi:hypothetical protein
MKTSRLIRCGDHKFAPRQFVCCHIQRKKAKAYLRIKDPSGDRGDCLLCSGCVAQIRQREGEGIDVISVCLHCARRLTKGMIQTAEDVWDDCRREGDGGPVRTA